MNVMHPAVTQLLRQHEAMKTLDHTGRHAFMLAVEAMAPIPVAAALLAMQNLESTLSDDIKARTIKALRDQREILVSSPGSELAQGGVLEIDRAIRAVEGMG